MEKKAENVVRNIGAIAETTSIFYNTLSRQVPKDVALILTQHFMDLTITKRSEISPAAAAAVTAARIAEERRRAVQQQKKTDAVPEKPTEKNELKENKQLNTEEADEPEKD